MPGPLLYHSGEKGVKDPQLDLGRMKKALEVTITLLRQLEKIYHTSQSCAMDTITFLELTNPHKLKEEEVQKVSSAKQ
jgi:hypothetical protein